MVKIEEWSDGPVRTVTRKDIVPGIYGHVYVSGEVQGHPMGRVCLVGISSTTQTIGLTQSELRAAAKTLTELADALDDGA